MLNHKIAIAIIGLMCVAVVFAACTREITNNVTEQSAPSSCFGCHSDQDTRLVANELQWQNSRHASGLNTNRNTPPCSQCHTSEGFIDNIAGVGVGTALGSGVGVGASGNGVGVGGTAGGRG